MHFVSRIIVDHWKLVSWLVVFGSVLAVLGVLRLSFDVSPNAVFLSENAVSKQLQQLYGDFGHDDNEIVVVIEGPTLFEPEMLALLRQYRDRLVDLPDVLNVSSIFDLRERQSGLLVLPRYMLPDSDADRLKRQVTQHPIGKNQFVSADGNMLVMVAHIAGESLPLSKLSAAVADVHLLSERFETESGCRTLLAGHLVIRAETLESLRKSMVTGSLFATLVSALVAFMLFRGVWPVLICCAAPGLGVLWTLGVMGWAGLQIGALGTVIPTLVMVIGLTDAVHLLLETNRQLDAGKSCKEAVGLMLRRTGPACLLTSLTTVIGFGSLLLSQTPSVQQFGLCAALGSALALFADLLVLPILIRLSDPVALLGKYRSTEVQMFACMNWIATFPLRYAKVLSTVGIAASLLLVFPALKQNPDIIWTETLPDDSDATLALERADSVMGGALRAHVVVQWPQDRGLSDRETLRVAGEVHHAILNTEGMSGPFSVLNVLETIPVKDPTLRYRRCRRVAGDQLGRLVNESRRRFVVTAQVPNDGAAVLDDRLKVLEELLRNIEQQHPGYSLHVTGTVVAAARNMRAFIADLGMSLAVASLIIFLVLTLAFRSIRLGLISVVPNALPLLVTAAGLVLLGYPLQITSALTFSLCLGLAVDDTIHVMTRYQQLRAAGCSETLAENDAVADGEAVRLTICQVGPALAITTAILVSGFGAMLVSPMPGIQMFALLSCIILLTAFIGDLLILPAMLLAFASGTDEQRGSH